MSSANPFPGWWAAAKKWQFLLPCDQSRINDVMAITLCTIALIVPIQLTILESIYPTREFFQRSNRT